MLKYYSTNREAKMVDFETALFEGQAPDKGLYMPQIIPTFSFREIESMREKDYQEISLLVLSKFLEDQISKKGLKKMIASIYDFEIPIEKLSQNLFLMRLDQGPTASFKDFGAKMLAKLMEYFLKRKKEKMVILTATSGDTGSAVANAFFGIENIKVVILFPKNEVTKSQRKQMTTLGKNIITLAIEGKFDDCQAMVKRAFADPELKNLNLSSANSINLGRLFPQIIYYFFAFSKICKKGEKIIFSVPSGNFGNLTAGLLAKRMGLPVEKFIVAVNENDEFPRFLETSSYTPLRPSKNCLSNAMNIGHPSNLARVIDLYGGLMRETGEILKLPNMRLLKNDIFSVSISDKETIKTIERVYQRYHTILEPHGAVGWRALELFLEKEKKSFKAVCLETAHPGKFPEVLEKVLKKKIKIPEAIERCQRKKERFEVFPADYEKFRSFLKTIK